MPIYEYKCTNGHHFEVVQRMTDDPVSTCEQCGEPVERVFRPVAVHFKGSGFYTTDYARKKAASAESKDGKPSESKAADKASSAKPSEPAKASSSSSDD